MQQDSSAIKEQLVSDFIPIDGCPVGTQLTESPVQVYRSEEKNNKPRENVSTLLRSRFLKFEVLYYSNIIRFHLLSQAETQLLIPENDAVPSPPEEQLGLDTQPNAKTAFLLSIDELLNAVSSFSFWF